MTQRARFFKYPVGSRTYLQILTRGQPSRGRIEISRSEFEKIAKDRGIWQAYLSVPEYAKILTGRGTTQTERRVQKKIKKIKIKHWEKDRTEPHREGRWPYQILAKYTHMRKRDVEVWEKFIRKFPNAYERVDYDYHLGVGEIGHEDDRSAQRAGWRKLKHLRADVIGYKRDGSIDVIEVKPKARTSAFGQVIAYGILFEQDWPSKEITPMILTDIIHDDIKLLSARLGIKVVEV